jgi:hypothetical protein
MLLSKISMLLVPVVIHTHLLTNTGRYLLTNPDCIVGL